MTMRGTSAQCGFASGLFISTPRLARAGFHVQGARPLLWSRHPTLARILIQCPELLHPNFDQTSPPRHPPFRSCDKTISSTFPQKRASSPPEIIQPSRLSVQQVCASRAATHPITELQCLSGIGAFPPRSPTPCHPFPASQLLPFHISKPTPSDRLPPDLYRRSNFGACEQNSTSPFIGVRKKTRLIPESWPNPERFSRSRFVHILPVGDTANPKPAPPFSSTSQMP